jgi:hypothetical protein
MSREIHVRPRISAQRESRGVDGAIAELATRQHGVVARWQLERLGMSRHEVGGRMRAGRLHPLHRAVYAVGHRRLSREGRYLAAVLSAGEGAVLSHCSAADLWELRATKEAGIGPLSVGLTQRRDICSEVFYFEPEQTPSEIGNES